MCSVGPLQVLLRKGGIKEPTFRPAAREFLLFPTAFHTDAQLLKPAAAAKYAQVRWAGRAAGRCEVGGGAHTLLCSPAASAHLFHSALPLHCAANSTEPSHRPCPALPPQAIRFDPKAQPQLEFSVFARVTGAWTTFDSRVLELLDGLHVWTPAFLEARLRWRERQPITVLELRAYRRAQALAAPWCWGAGPLVHGEGAGLWHHVCVCVCVCGRPRRCLSSKAVSTGDLS